MCYLSNDKNVTENTRILHSILPDLGFALSIWPFDLGVTYYLLVSSELKLQRRTFGLGKMLTSLPQKEPNILKEFLKFALETAEMELLVEAGKG